MWRENVSEHLNMNFPKELSNEIAAFGCVFSWLIIHFLKFWKISPYARTGLFFKEKTKIRLLMLRYIIILVTFYDRWWLFCNLIKTVFTKLENENKYCFAYMFWRFFLVYGKLIFPIRAVETFCHNFFLFSFVLKTVGKCSRYHSSKEEVSS